MKIIIASILAMVVSCSSNIANAHNSVISATNPSVIYEGRVEFTDSSARFDWSGTVIRVNFTGTRLEMVCKDSRCDWFNLWIDKAQNAKQDSTFSIRGTQKTIIVKDLAFGQQAGHLYNRYKDYFDIK